MRHPFVLLAMIAANCFIQTGHSGHWISCEETTAAELAIDSGLHLLQPAMIGEDAEENESR